MSLGCLNRKDEAGGKWSTHEGIEMVLREWQCGVTRRGVKVGFCEHIDGPNFMF